jgi:type IV fimbrial biogenesis protein FimU
MKKTVSRNPASFSKGITLIEILLALGLLVILLSFAMPSVSGAASKAEMRAAAENVQYSLQIARKTARMTEASVSMHISPEGKEPGRAFSFSSTGGADGNGRLQIPDFILPADIQLVSDFESYLFNERGLVENPGRILLVSALDESVTSTIHVK